LNVDSVFAFGLLTAGLALLLFSGRHFVEAIAAIAEALGVPPVVVGMTLVAFGTSTPELVINVLAASRGETALAFGNIAGSSTINIGFVLAVTAIVRPLKVEPSLITREIPMLWVAVGALLVLSHDIWLNGAAVDSLERSDGLILLLLFGIFVYYTAIYSLAKRKLTGMQAADAFLEEAEQEAEGLRRGSLLRHGAITGLSLVGISLGADWTVDGATGVARWLGISENLIGLTIVSFGTTLPELVTCVAAARRGDADIALGNVVGSNLFNILAIGGMVCTVSPVAIPPGGGIDLAFMALLSAVLLPLAIRSGQTVTRGEGVLLMGAYVGFLVWRLQGF
jgi:cation:H+ antiporter